MKAIARKVVGLLLVYVGISLGMTGLRGVTGREHVRRPFGAIYFGAAFAGLGVFLFFVKGEDDKRRAAGSVTAELPAKSYVDAGVELTHSLVKSLGLSGWEHDWQGLPLPQYKPEEAKAIHMRLASFHRIANDAVKGEARFHPEVAEELQRVFAAEALHEFAGNPRTYSIDVEPPKPWKERVSTYLKAWVCDLDPRVLLDMADLLAKQGYKGEARRALQVVLQFPSFAHNTSYGGPENSRRLADVMKEAEDAMKCV